MTLHDPRIALDARTVLDRLDLVPPPRPPMRRRRRAVHLHLSRLADQHGITRRLALLGGTPAAAWTLSMLMLALAVRY